MSSTAWMTFVVIIGLIIFANFFFFKNKEVKKVKNQDDDIIPPKIAKDPWQIRNPFYGFLYYVGPYILLTMGLGLVFFVIVNGF